MVVVGVLVVQLLVQFGLELAPGQGGFEVVVLQCCFKVQNVLEMGLQNWILSCNLWVTVTPDVAEWIKGLIRVTCEEYIALLWG